MKNIHHPQCIMGNARTLAHPHTHTHMLTVMMCVRFFDSVVNKDSPLPATVQQATAVTSHSADQDTVDISDLIREAYEVHAHTHTHSLLVHTVLSSLYLLNVYNANDVTTRVCVRDSVIFDGRMWRTCVNATNCTSFTHLKKRQNKML